MDACPYRAFDPIFHLPGLVETIPTESPSRLRRVMAGLLPSGEMRVTVPRGSVMRTVTRTPAFLFADDKLPMKPNSWARNEIVEKKERAAITKISLGERARVVPTVRFVLARIRRCRKFSVLASISLKRVSPGSSSVTRFPRRRRDRSAEAEIAIVHRPEARKLSRMTPERHARFGGGGDGGCCMQGAGSCVQSTRFKRAAGRAGHFFRLLRDDAGSVGDLMGDENEK